MSNELTDSQEQFLGIFRRKPFGRREQHADRRLLVLDGKGSCGDRCIHVPHRSSDKDPANQVDQVYPFRWPPDGGSPNLVLFEEMATVLNVGVLHASVVSGKRRGRGVAVARRGY